mmetsp:Transcript_4099/g.9223  ORF Transcript_4099/g.9223 Transcript_4099/m.9223 type:complete len:559 (-) Transcript_4099:534-2210(-)
MQDDTTQQIEEKLSERLLGPSSDGDNCGHNNTNVFRIDGDHGNTNRHSNRHINNHEDISATAIMEAGEIIVDPGAAAGSAGFGGHQPLQPEYRDTPFALAFLAHLGVMVFFATAWGFSAMRQDETTGASQSQSQSQTTDDDNTNSSSSGSNSIYLSGLLWLSCLTCIASIGISAVSLQIMMHHAETLIQSSLIGSCVFMGITIALFLIDGVFWMAVLWTLMLLVTVWYARSVWHTIPFAAANLRTALSAIQTNGGICALAYGIAALANAWTVVWVLAFVGVTFREPSSCVSGVCTYNTNVLSVVLLILSFYWTIQVLQNVLHVTVSGVVGTWWFAPRESLSVFSPAIVDSFRRATTYSFGSICMGSLLVAVIQSLEALARSAHQNDSRGGILFCIVECILRMLSRIAEYFNRWAYCYIGLYGFDYVSSGKKAMELFQARGWTTIVTDNLIYRSLLLVAIVAGGISAFLGVLLAKATGWASTTSLGENTNTNSDGTVFLLLFLIGVSMSYILMKVVLSAVDTVIVAFAEAPAEFNTHHPALYNNMIQKWRLVFPDECGF